MGEIKQSCPSCSYSWTNNLEASMFNLKKVDFIWINRDQKSFEWFVNLLSQLEKEDRDLVTGLKARTNAGRPNWNKVFTKLREEKKGQVTVFYCGNPVLGRTLKAKCAEFGFKFRKEIF